MTSKQFRRNPIYKRPTRGPPGTARRARALGRIAAFSSSWRSHRCGTCTGSIAAVPFLHHKALLSTLRARAAQHDADSGARAQHAVDAAK